MLVCLSLILSIGCLQMVSYLGMNLQRLFCHIIRCFTPSYCYEHDSQITNLSWVTSVGNLKWGLTSRSIHLIIVSKLDLRQDNFLVFLLVTTNTAQHVALSTIDHLCLTICLGMEGTTKLQLCAKLIPNMLPEFTNKLYIPVKSNSLWNTMQAYYLTKE